MGGSISPALCGDPSRFFLFTSTETQAVVLISDGLMALQLMQFHWALCLGAPPPTPSSCSLVTELLIILLKKLINRVLLHD